MQEGSCSLWINHISSTSSGRAPRGYTGRALRESASKLIWTILWVVTIITQTCKLNSSIVFTIQVFFHFPVLVDIPGSFWGEFAFWTAIGSVSLTEPAPEVDARSLRLYWNLDKRVVDLEVWVMLIDWVIMAFQENWCCQLWPETEKHIQNGLCPLRGSRTCKERP